MVGSTILNSLVMTIPKDCFHRLACHKKHEYDLIHFLLRAENATYWLNIGRFFFFE